MKNKWVDRNISIKFYPVFNKEECSEIIRIGNATNVGKSTVFNAIETNHRVSENGWINLKDHRWIGEKLSTIAFAANKHYGFDVDSLNHYVQFTRYTVGSHYSWHYDMGPHELSRRKISLVTMLSDPKEYGGGELEFMSNSSVNRDRQGSVIVFPSYEVHRVRPVESGERYTLVSWLEGSPFE